MKYAKPLYKTVLATLCLSACALAYAQSAGNLSVRIGATQLKPAGASEDLSAPMLPGSKIQASTETGLTGGLTYMVTDNVAVDMPLGLGFKIDLMGAGNVSGTGKLGDVKALPITLLTQYRFMAPTAAFRPYVGAGLTYAYFYDTNGTAALSTMTGGRPTTFKVGSKLAPSLQLGAVYAVNDKWFVEASLIKTMLKNRTTLSTGNTVDYKINPTALNFAVGYRY